MKEIVSTENAPSPAAGSPYSQAVKANGFLFVSGQIPLDRVTGEMIEGEIKEQALQAFTNLKAVLEAGGSSTGKVVKTTVFLTDLNDFEGMNRIYKVFFERDFPARSAVQVARLPFGAKIEVEAIAVLD